MSNYTHFSSLGYQVSVHPSQSRGVVNPLGRISPNDIEQEARDEQERRQREDQERIEQERARRKRASLSKLKEGFSDDFVVSNEDADDFSGRMKSSNKFDISGTSILDLTGSSVDTIQDTLDEYPQSLVWFFAPWCGHCITFTPVFIEAEKNFRGKVKFIMIDADRNSDAGRFYNIRGFPTVKFFTKSSSQSKGEEYNGPRSAKGLAEFLNSQ